MKVQFSGGLESNSSLLWQTCASSTCRACLKDIYFGAWYVVLNTGVKLIPHSTLMRLPIGFSYHALQFRSLTKSMDGSVVGVVGDWLISGSWVSILHVARARRHQDIGEVSCSPELAEDIHKCKINKSFAFVELGYLGTWVCLLLRHWLNFSSKGFFNLNSWRLLRTHQWTEFWAGFGSHSNFGKTQTTGFKFWRIRH
jgi:hypothetical protein